MNTASCTRRRFLKNVGLSLAALTLPRIASAGSTPAKRPNILLIMADDLGYSDLGCFGGEISTPNLDALAEKGVRFTQFYNSAKCNPTRAALLTGNYEHAVGVNDIKYGATFAEVLRPAGYRTLISGKWHQNPLPTTRGFERYFGLADGCCNYFNPGTVARPGEGPPGRKRPAPRRWAIEGEAIMGYVPDDKDFYTTDAFADYAIERLEQYKDEDEPFLLYMPFTAPHYPLHAWPEDIARYRGKYMSGWDQMRKSRYKRQLEIGLVDKSVECSRRDPRNPAWDSLTQKEKDEADLRMAVYAAMVHSMDRAIGRVFDEIKKLGKWDNTLIMFLADNGGCPETPNTTPDIPPGPVESYRALGPEWANATNTPYRKYKSTDFEGGCCTPFIAHWPGVIEPGTFTNQVGHIIDINPTLMDITGADYPTTLNGQKLKRPVGKSLVPIFQGKHREPHEALFFQFGSAKAVRQGDWKLVKLGKDPWELYNLKEGRTELNDLADQHPDRVDKMVNMWERWMAQCKQKP